MYPIVIPFLSHTLEEGPVITESILCIMDQTIRIYLRKIDQIHEPEKPFLQIPIIAVSDICVNVNDQYLNLEPNLVL